MISLLDWQAQFVHFEENVCQVAKSELLCLFGPF